MNNKLPDGWQWKKIEEIAGTTSGGTPLRSRPEYYGGNIPWAKSGELRDGIIREVEETITEEGFRNSSAKLFPKDTVVVALYGATVGRTGILGIDATTNQAVCGIFPRNHAFISKYMFYWLQSQRQNLINQSMGGAQPNISQGIIRSLYFPLAPISEQERIVAKIEELFTQLEAGTSALERVRAGLRRYKASVLKAAVEGKLVEQYVNDKPASELLNEILATRKKPATPPDTSELGKLPRGWVWATAEQLSEAERSITYGVVKLGEEVDNGIPTLRSSNVRHLHIETDVIKRISPEIANQYKRTKLQGGEVLITVRGTLGGVAVVPDELAGCNISREVAMIALIDKRIASIVQYFIASKPLQIWLTKRTRGIAYTGVNIETLKELPIPLPPLEEQRRIVAEVERRLSVARQVESAVKAALVRASRLRQSVLKSAFEGRLV